MVTYIYTNFNIIRYLVMCMGPCVMKVTEALVDIDKFICCQHLQSSICIWKFLQQLFRKVKQWDLDMGNICLIVLKMLKWNQNIYTHMYNNWVCTRTYKTQFFYTVLGLYMYKAPIKNVEVQDGTSFDLKQIV